MEEDIKVLEERVNFCKNNKECREELKQCFGCTFEVEEIQVIENLIKGYKELEKYKRKHSLVKNNYIPKSKVREKIDIMNTNIVNAERFDRDYIGNCRFAKYILQELLQEGDKVEQPEYTMFICTRDEGCKLE